MRKMYFFLLISFFGNASFAQNLISNGSFENLKSCPDKFSQLSELCEGITVPSKGTSDVYSSCNDGKFGVPSNVKGTQEPFEGQNYAGFYLFAPQDYREYIQIPLSQTLEKGQTYQLNFYLSYAESSNFPTPDIQAYLVHKPVEELSSKNLTYQSLSFRNTNKVTKVDLEVMGDMTSTEDWVQIQAEITAKGYENFLIVGNFKNNKNTELLPKHKGRSGFSYYFFDAFSMESQPLMPYAFNKDYVLDLVHFEHDSFQIRPDSFKQLDDLYNTLAAVEGIQLNIQGHTNDLGSDEHNDFLSFQRAKAVANYLVEKGFPRDRINFNGFGSESPLIPTQSEEARTKNRRVEFAITKFEDQ